MKSRFYKAAQKLGLAFFSLALVLVTAEIGARLLGVGRAAELDPSYDRPTRYYLSEPRPPKEAGEEPLRIAVIGDSFTEGESVQVYDRYAARLEWMLNLNAAARPAAVEVYAKRGTSTSNQVLMLRNALKKEVDLIILGVFLNDPEANLDPELWKWRQLIQPRPVAGWKRNVLRSSRFLAWTYHRLEKLRVDRAAVAYTRRIYEPEYVGWDGFMWALRVFARDTRAHKVPLVAVIFPPMAGFEETYPLTDIHPKLHSALDKHGIPYLDLLERYRGRSSERMAAYPGIDAHPSEVAHRIAAEAIFEHLLAKGYIGSEYEPRFRAEPSSEWQDAVVRRRSVVWWDQPQSRRGQSSQTSSDNPTEP